MGTFTIGYKLYWLSNVTAMAIKTGASNSSDRINRNDFCPILIKKN